MNITDRMKIDRYFDQNGNVVFTERFLIDRGVCCGLGCKDFPYYPKHEAGNADLSKEMKTLIKTSNAS